MKRGNIGLYFMTNVKYGGFVAFTVHLYRGLVQMGWTPRVFKIRKRTEKKLRPFCGSIGYQNISMEDAHALGCGEEPGLIVCADWKKYSEAITMLLENGAGLVFHDPTEFREGLIQTVLEHEIECVVIRKRNRRNLRKLGVKSRFIRHPYVRAEKLSAEHRPEHAASISRVDWDKHTEMIVEANTFLPRKKQVHIWGQSNRIFEFHKLNKVDPDWKRNYKGTFPLRSDGGCSVARRYGFIVDMSAIKGDGDGTQYTFLEAWDRGCVLIVSSSWIRSSEKSVIQNGRNAIVVNDVDELVWALRRKWKTGKLDKMHFGGYMVLGKHTPDKVIPKFETYIEEVCS